MSRDMLPGDLDTALLAGRIALPEGPTPVIVRGGMVHDVSRTAATMADLLDLDDPAAADGPIVCPVEANRLIR